MIIGHCTFCGGVVRIPINVSWDTSVRCPHCQETCDLGTLLRAAVPELEIVDDPQQDTPPEQAAPAEVEIELQAEREKGTKFEVSPVLKKGAIRPRRSRRNRDRDKQSESEVITIDTVTHRIEGSTRQPAVGEHRGRSGSGSRSARSSRSGKRNEFKKSSDFEIFKVVLGALLAFPVAQLLIWWVISVDPLKLGPPTSQVIPAVVPARFHGEPRVKPDNQPGAEDGAGENGSSEEEDGSGEGGDLADVDTKRESLTEAGDLSNDL